MKKLHSLLLPIIALLIISCSSDEKTTEEPETIPFTMQFDYDGQTIIMEKSAVTDIKNITTNTIIGRSVQGYLIDPEHNYGTKYHINMAFYTSGDGYELHDITFTLPVTDMGSAMGYYKSAYSNTLNNPAQLPFSHNINYQNGTFSGTFSGKVTDGRTYSDGSLRTITIENGKIDYTLPY